MDWIGLVGFTAYMVVLVIVMFLGLEIIKRISK